VLMLMLTLVLMLTLMLSACSSTLRDILQTAPINNFAWVGPLRTL